MRCVYLGCFALAGTGTAQDKSPPYLISGKVRLWDHNLNHAFQNFRTDTDGKVSTFFEEFQMAFDGFTNAGGSDHVYGDSVIRVLFEDGVYDGTQLTHHSFRHDGGKRHSVSVVEDFNFWVRGAGLSQVSLTSSMNGTSTYAPVITGRWSKHVGTLFAPSFRREYSFEMSEATNGIVVADQGIYIDPHGVPYRKIGNLTLGQEYGVSCGCPFPQTGYVHGTADYQTHVEIVALEPRIALDNVPVIFDTGTTLVDGNLLKTFTVRNVGQNPLIGEMVLADSAFTQFSFPGTHNIDLEHGESLDVEVTFDPELGLSGLQRGLIEITSNDPSMPIATVELLRNTTLEETSITALSVDDTNPREPIITLDVVCEDCTVDWSLGPLSGQLNGVSSGLHLVTLEGVGGLPAELHTFTAEAMNMAGGSSETTATLDTSFRGIEVLQKLTGYYILMEGVGAKLGKRRLEVDVFNHAWSIPGAVYDVHVAPSGIISGVPAIRASITAALQHTQIGADSSAIIGFRVRNFNAGGEWSGSSGDVLHMCDTLKQDPDWCDSGGLHFEGFGRAGVSRIDANYFVSTRIGSSRVPWAVIPPNLSIQL